MIKVAFDYTLDELVEVTLRSQRKSNTYQREFRRGIWMTGGATFVVIYLLIREAFWVRLTTGIIFALITMGVNWLLARQMTSRRIKKYYQELIRDPWPIHLEIELNESGLVARERDSVSELKWSRITNVEEVEKDRSVEFMTNEGRLVVVRARAFNSEDEKQQFIHFAKQHIQPLTQESK